MLFNYIKNDFLIIVVTSFIVLKQDIMRKANFFKFKAKIYEETTHYKASLIFILYETLKNNFNFLKFSI